MSDTFVSLRLKLVFMVHYPDTMQNLVVLLASEIIPRCTTKHSRPYTGVKFIVKSENSAQMHACWHCIVPFGLIIQLQRPEPPHTKKWRK